MGAQKTKNNTKTTTLLPFRCKIHQLGHVVTDTSFEHKAVFVCMSIQKGQREEWMHEKTKTLKDILQLTHFDGDKPLPH